MKNNYLKNNLFLFIPLLLIMIMSFLNLYNARLLRTSFQYHYLKQIIWYIIGIIILIMSTKLNLKKVFKFSFWLYFFNVLLLGLVLFFGKEVNGSKAWFDFKWFSFQPSELMKLSLSLYLARLISQFKYSNFKNDFFLILKVFFISFLPAILAFLEPDTGSIMMYFIIAFSALLISGIKKRWFLITFLIIFFFGGLFLLGYFYKQDLLIKWIGTSFFYRIERLISFKNQNSYQLEQALIAIGSASWLGSGLNKVSLYIPEAPTDFILAFHFSNFGFLGGILILSCYLVLNIYLLKIYFSLNNKLAKVFLISFLGLFFFQQLENILMNIGLAPIIGLPLPFLSYGGTNTIIYFLYLALILNIKKLRINT